MSIRLSPKFGLNPSMSICFFCQKEKNEIIIPGLLSGDAEAPRKAVWNKEPCDECKAHMNQGIILISVDEKKSFQDKENPYRTGGWVLIKEDAIKRMIKDKKLLSHILEKRVAFVPDDTWNHIGLPR
jgi:hypothetical protein